MAAWPTGADLSAWLTGKTSPDRQVLYDEIVEGVTDVVWGDLDASLMPDQTLPEDQRCPGSVRMAVLILAARVDSRRQSTNGVITAGDLFVRVGRDDPDYARLIARYAVSAEP